MRIAYTSDLHIDSTPHNRAMIERIVDTIAARGADVVIVAGDAGNTLDAVDEALALFTALRCPKFFVAGNHDVWIERTGAGYLNSRDKYDRYLPELCAKHGFHDLGQGPKVVGHVAFVGSLGWYDYTFADPSLDMSDDDYWKGRWGEVIWWDKDMTFWPSVDGASRSRLRDGEVCAELTEVFERHVCEAETQVDHILAVLHTVPFVDSIPRQDPPYLRDAFTGGRQLGDVLRAHPKIRHCVGAHKHLEGDWNVDGVHYYRRPLGRPSEDDSFDEVLARSVGFIEF